jgi:hypothetical protein
VRTEASGSTKVAGRQDTPVAGIYIRSSTLVLYQNILFTGIPAANLLVELAVAILRCRHSTMAFYAVLQVLQSILPLL